jgi:hypothetical protein
MACARRPRFGHTGPMSTVEPRRGVEAPIRRAVLEISLGGALLGVAALVGLWCVLAADLPEAVHVAIGIGLPVALLACAVAIAFVRVLHGSPAQALEATAWERAAEVDPADAQLARLIAMWVPAALFVSLALGLWAHLARAANADAAAPWWLLGLPGYAAAWIAVVTAWSAMCRDRLARADLDSRRRLRAYWSHPGA